MEHVALQNTQYNTLIEEKYPIATLSNIAAFIHQHFQFHWQGFYLVQGGELTLGPFQGPVACNPIAKGKGVCGKSWEQNKTILVPNVEQFEGHIACSPLTKSELVVPIFDAAGNVCAVLDLDSTEENYFSSQHQSYFERLCASLGILF